MKTIFILLGLMGVFVNVLGSTGGEDKDEKFQEIMRSVASTSTTSLPESAQPTDEEGEDEMQASASAQVKKKKKKHKKKKSAVSSVASTSSAAPALSFYDFLFETPTAEGPHPSTLPDGPSWEERVAKKILVYVWDWLLEGKNPGLRLEVTPGQFQDFSPDEDFCISPPKQLRKRMLELYIQKARKSFLSDRGEKLRESLPEGPLKELMYVCFTYSIVDFFSSPMSGCGPCTGRDFLDDLERYANFIFKDDSILGGRNPKRVEHLLKCLQLSNKILPDNDSFGRIEAETWGNLWYSYDLAGNKLSLKERLQLIGERAFKKNSISARSSICHLIERDPRWPHPQTGKPFTSPWARIRFLSQNFKAGLCPEKIDKVPDSFPITPSQVTTQVISSAQQNLAKYFDQFPTMYLEDGTSLASVVIPFLWTASVPQLLCQLANNVISGHITYSASGLEVSQEELIEDVFNQFPVQHSEEGMDPHIAQGLGYLYYGGLRKKHVGETLVLIEETEALGLAEKYWQCSQTRTLLVNLYLRKPQFKPHLTREAKEELALRIIQENDALNVFYECLIDGYFEKDLEGHPVSTLEERIETAIASVRSKEKSWDSLTYKTVLFKILKNSIANYCTYLKKLNLQCDFSFIPQIIGYGEELMTLLEESDGILGRDLSLGLTVKNLIRALKTLIPPEQISEIPSKPAEKESKTLVEASTSSSALRQEETSSEDMRDPSHRLPEEEWSEEEEQEDTPAAAARIFSSFTEREAGEKSKSILDDPRFIWAGPAKKNLLRTDSFQQYKKRANPLLNKLIEHLESMMKEEEAPHTVLGPRERLKRIKGPEGEGIYSRKLSDEHRLTYYFTHDGNIVIQKLLGHYED